MKDVAESKIKEEILEGVDHASKVINAWLPWKIKYDKVPGISVGLTYKGKLVYKAGYGYAKLNPKIKATPDTCYRIGSISKTFTSIAILQLVENGKLKLDDPIERYLPWVKIRNGKITSKNITIRQLLSHTGGIWRDGNTPHWATDRFPGALELKKSVSKNTMVFENLTRFKYSNFGFALLGEIIQEISGISYTEYVTKNIIKKLDLKHTLPDLDREIIGSLATGYSPIMLQEKRKSCPNVEMKSYAPAAGWTSNVTDLAKFLSVLALNSKDSILSRELKKEMMREHWKTTDEEGFYGLGIGIRKTNRRKFIGHAGGVAGFTSRIAFDPESEIGVITLTNATDGPADSINTGIFETICHFIDNKDDYNSKKQQSDMRKYEGCYCWRWWHTSIVGICGKLMAFSPLAESPMKEMTLLLPKNKDEFLIEEANNFAYVGETAKFIFKNGRKPQLIFGPTPLKLQII